MCSSAPRPRWRLSEAIGPYRSFWRDLLDTLEHQGPAELIHKIRAAQASDPAGTRWPRFKVGDDATAAFCPL